MAPEHIQAIAVGGVCLVGLVALFFTARKGGFVAFKTWFIELTSKPPTKSRIKVDQAQSRNGGININTTGPGHDLTATNLNAHHDINISANTEQK